MAGFKLLFLLFISFSIISDCFVPSSRSLERSTILFRQISTIPVRDGRKVKVHNSDFSPQLRLRVQRVAKAAIRKKNSFSMCLTGGKVPEYLTGLPKNLPYHKWHIFLADETLGENKTYNKVLDSFALECKIPIENIHFIGQGDAASVAMDYEKEIRLHPAVDNKGSGCPHVDLMLLEAGVKGRVARLLPDSREVKDTGVSSQAIMAVQGENSITVSIDFIRAARTSIICATGASRSPMMEIALTRSFYKHECPAGMIYSNKNTVQWYTDLEATAHFRACIRRMREDEFKREKDLSMENNMLGDAPV